MSPGASTQELIFAGAVEGLFLKGLGARVTPELRGLLKVAGLDLSAPLLPGYTRAVWNDALAIAAPHIWPQLEVGEAHVMLGRATIEGFTQTLLGKAVAALAKVLGPMRTLGRMRANLRSGGNYSDTSLTAETPTQVRFWINEPFIHPGYVKGVLQATLQISGARKSSVEVVSVDSVGTTYLVCWEA